MSRRADQRGIIMPTTILAGGFCAVAVAAVGFLLTSRPIQTDPSSASTPPRVHHRVARTPVASPTAEPTHKALPTVDRKDVSVVIFNNSNVKGLAATTATRAQGIGWKVIGEDNWYGTIDASTVYYPARLHRAAAVLARDLGIHRIKPAIAPMQLDRLTVILTADYQP